MDNVVALSLSLSLSYSPLEVETSHPHIRLRLSPHPRFLLSTPLFSFSPFLPSIPSHPLSSPPSLRSSAVSPSLLPVLASPFLRYSLSPSSPSILPLPALRPALLPPSSSRYGTHISPRTCSETWTLRNYVLRPIHEPIALSVVSTFKIRENARPCHAPAAAAAKKKRARKPPLQAPASPSGMQTTLVVAPQQTTRAVPRYPPLHPTTPLPPLPFASHPSLQANTLRTFVFFMPFSLSSLPIRLVSGRPTESSPKSRYGS